MASGGSQALFARRLTEHRCLHCGDQLPAQEIRKLCTACRGVQSTRDAAAYQRRIAKNKCAKCSGTIPAGHDRVTCPACLKKVRERCWRVRQGASPPTQRTRVFVHRESPKWAALEASSARCRCGLLLPCNSCLVGDASSRSGPGRVYPSGGGY